MHEGRAVALTPVSEKCPWPESNRLHRNSRAAPAVAPLHAGDRCGRTGESLTYWTVLVRRETDCLMPACVPGAGVEPAFSRTIRRMIRAKSLRARRNGIGFSALAAELPSTRDGRDSNPRPLRHQWKYPMPAHRPHDGVGERRRRKRKCRQSGGFIAIEVSASCAPPLRQYSTAPPTAMRRSR